MSVKSKNRLYRENSKALLSNNDNDFDMAAKREPSSEDEALIELWDLEIGENIDDKTVLKISRPDIMTEIKEMVPTDIRALLLHHKKFVRIFSRIIPGGIKSAVRGVPSMENRLTELNSVSKKKDTGYHQGLLEKFNVPGWLDAWYKRCEAYLEKTIIIYPFTP